MKISVLQENLSKAVGAAARSVASRPQLPVLANLLLEAQQGKLLVTATDLVTSVGLTVGGKVQEEGALTVPAKDFAALVSALPAQRVELVGDKGVLKLTAAGVKARFIGIPAAEFPERPVAGENRLVLKLDQFAEAMKRVLFAVSADEGRPILTGVKILSSAHTLQLVATDGYRLSVIAIPVVSGSLEQAVVVPGRVLGDVLRLAGDGDVSMSLSGDNSAVFTFDGGWVAGRLLAGEFPPAERIIPESVELEITVDRAELERAVRVAAIFARESANVVRWKITDGTLAVSANSPQIGENETILEVNGKGSGEIAFNARYLLDWLGSVTTERVVFGMVSATKPGVFRPEGDTSYTHVIMPVRVQK